MIERRLNWRLILVSMLALAMLVSMFLPPVLMPTAVSAWDAGNSQTMQYSYNDPTEGSLTETWTWTVIDDSVDVGGVDCYKMEATIAPDYTDPWGLGGAYRTVYMNSSCSMGGAVITQATSFRDNADGKPIKMVSTQKVFGGFITNVATVDTT